MFKTLINNLSRAQKIGFLVFFQIIIIVVLVLVVQSFIVEKQHVSIESEGLSEEIPKEAENFIADNIWQVIKSNIPNADQNEYDVVVREGTYEETEYDDRVEANFIVDIDELKQSYTVSTGWSKDKSVIYEVIVNCPPIDLMKYSETMCVGMYNNTTSIDLYLPYFVYPEGYDNNDEILAPNIYIDGNESEKTIDVMVSTCDVEGFKEGAIDYLNSLPIDLSDYTINYEINEVNVRC